MVMSAVKKAGAALWCASEALRNNEEMVHEAVKQDELVLNYANPRFRANKKIFMAIWKKILDSLSLVQQMS